MSPSVGGEDAEEKGGFQGEQGGLRSDTEGETTRLQVNLYP